MNLIVVHAVLLITRRKVHHGLQAIKFVYVILDRVLILEVGYLRMPGGNEWQ